MGKRAITPELYNDLIRAFRLQPGIYGAAARACGCCHKTAKKAWHKGWEDKGFLPIAKILENEKAQVRTQVALMEGEVALENRAEIMQEMAASIDGHLEAEASKVYALKVKMEELAMLGNARGLVTANLQSLRSMAEASELLASRLGASIREFAMDESEPLVFGTPEYNRAQRAFRGIAMSAREITTAVKTTLEAERLHMGEPTEIIGHKDLDDMSIEELVAEIEESDDTIKIARRRGLIALDGGKNTH